MNWWNLLTFCVIPLLSVVAVFCVKRKFLWLAPLVSTGLTILISIGAMPTILSDTEHRSMFFGISLPLHLAVVIVLTGAAYATAYVLNRKRTRK